MNRFRIPSLTHLSILMYGIVFLPLGSACSVGQTDSKNVAVYLDSTAEPILFAAQEIRHALEENGLVVTEKPLEQLSTNGDAVRIVLTVKDHPDTIPKLLDDGGTAVPELKPQGYAIRSTGQNIYWAVGADQTGAMYGGLHIAEIVQLEKSLDKLVDTFRSPSIARRGIKFNIPLDARTPSYDDTGDAAQNNYAEMWNFDFWKEFLDDLARYRYNTLTLWNPHPFPSIVKLPDYPDVALDDVYVTKLPVTEDLHREWRIPEYWDITNMKLVKKISIDDKIEFWRRVMRYAKDRGIDIYFITWNVFVNGVGGKYGITNEQNNLKTIAYIRQCVRETLLTYPLLAGIGVTAGEYMQHRDDEFSKEKWLWKTYGMGLLDVKKKQPKRNIRFIHRHHQTGLDEIMKEFGYKYPDTFDTGFKYARAHMYSSPKPPFAKSLIEAMKKHSMKCWWNIRNDDIFNFRWGDPDYARAFLANLPPEELTAGYHMGSDGYVWGREFTSIEPESPRELEIKKHWYNFMLWGRLGYNLNLTDDFFVKVLNCRFPETDADALYRTWATASKIIPLVNRFHWNDWDYQWMVEGCFDQEEGFHTVRRFIKNPTMQDCGIMAVPQYVDRYLAKKPMTGKTPPQVSAELRSYSETTLKEIANIRHRTSRMSKRLRLTLNDTEAMAHLGNYYASKILGAVQLHLFEKSKNKESQQEAVHHLLEAQGRWQNYASVVSELYRPQLLARTRRLDWNEILEHVKKDVEIARNAGEMME